MWRNSSVTHDETRVVRVGSEASTKSWTLADQDGECCVAAAGAAKMHAASVAPMWTVERTYAPGVRTPRTCIAAGQRSPPPRSRAADGGAGPDAQRLRELLERGEREGGFPPLGAVDDGGVDAGPASQLGLGPGAALPRLGQAATGGG